MKQNLFNYNDEDIDSVVNYSHKLLNRKFAVRTVLCKI